MKKLTILFCLLTIISLKGFSQMPLTGRWFVNCGVKGVDEGNPKCCEICPVDTHRVGKSAWKVSGFQMEFKKDSVEINMSSLKKTTTVPYKGDNAKKSISFMYEGKSYIFTVKENEKHKGEYVLTDDKDQSLYLQKVGLK